MSQGVNIVINKRLQGQHEAYAEAVAVQQKIIETQDKDKELEASKTDLLLILGSVLALFNMVSLLRYTVSNLKDLFSGKISMQLIFDLAFDVLYMYRRYRAAMDALTVLYGMSLNMDELEYAQYASETIYSNIPWGKMS